MVAALVRKWVEAEIAKAPQRRGLGDRQADPRIHLRRGLCRRDRPGRRAVQRRDHALEHRHGVGTSIRELAETVHAVSGYKGKMVWNADKPDGAAKKVLDVTRMKQVLDGWSPPTDLKAGLARRWPGTVPTRPGGLQMVNGWTRPGRFRIGPNGAAESLSERRIAAPKLRPIPVVPPETDGRNGSFFVNQYYWPDHASTAQHLTDLAESLADRGYECHVVCSRGGYSRGSSGGRLSRSTTGSPSTGSAPSLRPASSVARMADYLSFYALAPWSLFQRRGSTRWSPSPRRRSSA